MNINVNGNNHPRENYALVIIMKKEPVQLPSPMSLHDVTKTANQTQRLLNHDFQERKINIQKVKIYNCIIFFCCVIILA